MKNIKSIYTTAMGMLLSALAVIYHFLGDFSTLNMYICIGVGIVLVFFKDEWATQLWGAIITGIRGWFRKKNK